MKTNQEWKKILDPEVYKIVREKGTEPAFSGKYVHYKEDGGYHCAACGQKLFDSETKFDSGSGWPSFFKPTSSEVIDEKVDKSWFMERTEVVCAQCGAHLGHVFNDGPNPTGLRYCINSLALEFKKEKADQKEKESK